MRSATLAIALLFVTSADHPAHGEPLPLDPSASAPELPTDRSAFWRDYRRGWHFYEEPDPEPAPPPKQTRKSGPPRAPELVEFDRLRKQVEDLRHIAIIRPTETNVRRYMELEARVVQQASHFADVAQQVAWATPELDMTLRGRPVNARAIEVFDREQAAARSRSIAALARTHVLFFFFRSDCPYCHAFAPTLEAFQARHGLRVVPISVDGGGLPNFREFRRDNGLSQTLQVTQVPALFLARPITGEITPIGFGVLSESELVERISTLAAAGVEALAPSANRHARLE